MWLLPLVTGVIAYGFAAPGSDAGRKRPEDRGGEEVRQKRRTDVAAMMGEFVAQWESRQKADDEELPKKGQAMSGAELRQRLAALRDLKAETWDEWRAASVEGEALAKELGRREQDIGVRWLLENDSAVYFFGMDAWAASDPDGALDFVVRSDFARPCSKTALMTLLNAQAQQGPEALRNAVSRLPLEAFNEAYRSDRYGNEARGDSDGELSGLEMPEDARLAKVWRDSGAARLMAQQGLEFRGFFETWFADDEGAALENWATWPWLKKDHSDRDFIDWLSGRSGSDEGIRDAMQVLAEASPGTRAKAIAVLAGTSKEEGSTGALLREAFPELFHEAEPGP